MKLPGYYRILTYASVGLSPMLYEAVPVCWSDCRYGSELCSQFTVCSVASIVLNLNKFMSVMEVGKDWLHGAAECVV